MKIALPSGLPPWVQGLATKIEQNFVSKFPTDPVRLPVFQYDDLTGLGLPDPSKYHRTMIWVSSFPSNQINLPAYSNGLKWITLEGQEL
jgi:hypothetical protein